MAERTVVCMDVGSRCLQWRAVPKLSVVRNGLPKTFNFVLLDLLLCATRRICVRPVRVEVFQSGRRVEAKLGCRVMRSALRGQPGQEELRRAKGGRWEGRGSVDDYATTVVSVCKSCLEMREKLEMICVACLHGRQSQA